MWGLGSILLLPGREGLILDKKPSFVPPSLKTGKVSHCSLAPTPAQQAPLHQPQANGGIQFRSRRTGVSALSWLSPSGPALSWLLCPQPPVIAAYLLSCHRWTPRPLATNDYISQHPLCTMVTQPSSPSMPRPNMGGSPAPINSLGPGVHWAACSKKVFLMNALTSTPDPLSHGARFICPGPGREMVTSVSREKIVHFYFLYNSFLNSFHSCGPTLASARTLLPQIGTLS